MQPGEPHQRTLREREDALVDREALLRLREEAMALREETQRFAAAAQQEIETRNREMRQANENLVIATLQAGRLNDAAGLAHRQQDEFLAMLAHELRNPLASIRSAAALLVRLDESAPVPPLIHQVLRRQVEHMARLLDDLLDASRITSGRVRLQRRPTRLDEFVGHAAQTCSALIELQHQQFTLDLPETPIYVDGDPVRLAQVMGNLLHNAAKYTDPGGAIAIRARALRDQVEIRISDDGIGIAADVLPHIFDLFTQNDRSLSRSQGGLGIGLTVVRRMVELHGGSVEARSGGVDLGSEFIVTLPRIDPVAEQAVETNETAAPATASVLLVDDNVDAGEVMAMLLRLSGHRVATALDGPGALALFEAGRPQVVLCDIGLPGMDGYEVARRMRKEGDAPMLLMVALTGYGGATDRERALLAGFDHHLVKPADPEQVLRLIETFLKTALPAS
ncbi:MAG: ATP-binding protein [Caldimonas sp.]